MKKWISLLMVAIMMVVISGCGSTFKTDSSMVYVKKSGKILAASIETFDKDYYSEDGLKKYIKDQVDEYTQKHGKNTVKMTSYKVKDSEATLFMKYDTAQDYASFNGEEFFAGTIPEAVAAGYEFGDSYYEVKESATGNASTGEDFLDQSQWKVVITAENVGIRIDGDLKYVSDNVSILNDHTVEPAKEKSDINLITIIYE